MLTHGFGTVHPGLPSEPAVHRNAKIGEIFRCCRIPSFQAIDAVDWQHNPQVHASIVHVEVGERTKKRGVLTP
jgi:hypothetical protein